MMATIQGGDLVMVGGAVCVAPETCQTKGCGRPAEAFAGRRAADPHNSKVEGYCPECADVLAARRSWFAGLSREQVAERDRLDTAVFDAHGYYESSWADERAAAPARVRDARRAQADFQAATGYPAHPRGLNLPTGP